jgi:hypothetical protein
MFLVHRTLQPDSQISTMVAIRNATDRCLFLAFAQGTTLHIIDAADPSYRITQSYPFRSPIVAVAPVGRGKPSVFVLLRTHNWFILQIPDLLRFGNLDSPIFCRPSRSILRHASLLAPVPAGSNPTATATIRFCEESVACSFHPDFVALYIHADAIHVLPLSSESPPIIVPVVEANLVDMAFFPGPDVRIGFLCDAPKGRALHVVSLGRDRRSFVDDYTAELPNEAHSILPLSDTTLIVFTRDGIARIADQRPHQHSIEYLAVFLPSDGVILHACHFFGDVYLLCDSCGGLTGGLFTVAGRPRTEFMRSVGPASAIVAIDDRRFVIASPFGDSVIYEAEISEGGFRLTEVRRLPAVGPIGNMSSTADGIVCGTGRGDSGCVRLFERSIACDVVAEIPAKKCLGIFCAFLDDLLFLCLCFCKGSQVLAFDGSSLKAAEWRFLRERVITFGSVATGIAVVTDRMVRVVTSTGKVLSHFNFSDHPIIIGSVSPDSIVVINNSHDVYHFRPDLRTKSKFLFAGEPILVSSTSSQIAMVVVEGDVVIYDADTGDSRTRGLDRSFIPVSVAFSPGGILVGTSSGRVITITDEDIRTDQVSSEAVILHTIQGGAVGGGRPPFRVDSDGRILLISTDCSDAAIGGPFLACLTAGGVAIFRTGGDVLGNFRGVRRIPGLVRAFADDLCLLEATDGQSVVRLSDGARFQQDGRFRVSMVTAVTIGDVLIVVVGDDKPSITLLDGSLSGASGHKMLGVPTAACTCCGLLAVARPGAADFFRVKFLDGQFEIERKMIVEGHATAPDLLAVGDLVVAADIEQALIVFRMIGDAVIRVDEDTAPKHLNRLGSLGQWVFAAAFDPVVYCYVISDDGRVEEMGSFQCDSRVLAFCERDDRLLYGTAGGGIGYFEKSGEEGLIKLRDALEKEELCLRPDRVPKALFEWKQSNIFVDLDTLAVIQRLSDEQRENILREAKLDEEDLAGLL